MSGPPGEGDRERPRRSRRGSRRKRAEAETLAEPGSRGRGRKARRRSPRRHPDIEIARLLVKRGFLDKEAAVAALKVQKARARAGEPRIPFLRLLVKRKALAASRVPEAQDEIRRNTYLCERCNARAVILAGSQSRAGTCPRCGCEISVAPPTDPAAVPVRDFTTTGEATDPMSRSGPPDWRPLGSRYRPGLPLGEVSFRRYRILSELGRGAMGVVYEAEHLELGKTVALKVLFPDEDAREDQVARFRREAAAVQRLRHEHIVPVHDFGTDGEVYYLTMDLVPGRESLHTRLKDEEDPPSLRWRLETLVQVARAAHHAHSHGVVHRDLKPANVLLHPERGAMVADFGLAKDEEAEAAELTRTHDRLGTPLFMAPEQIRRGAGTVDQRADVWALGVMLFAAVTGRYPFRSRTVMDLYVRILREPPDWAGDKYSAPDRPGIPEPTRSAGSNAPPSAESSTGALPLPAQRGTRAAPPFAPPPELAGRGVPADLRAIVSCALAKDPDDRYPTAAAFADDLEAYLAGRPVRGGGPGLLKRLREHMGRRRVLRPLALALALLLVATALVGGLAYRHREAELALERDVESAWAQAVGGGRKGYAEAEARLTALLADRPDHARALWRRGLARLWLLREGEAEADLARAAELAAGDEDLAVRVAAARARAALHTGHFADAARRAASALARGGRLSFGARAELGELLALAALQANDEGLRAQAEAACTELARSPRSGPRLLALWGRLALARGDVAAARRRLERARTGQNERAQRSQPGALEVLLFEAALLHAEGERASGLLRLERRLYPSAASADVKYLDEISQAEYRARSWKRNVHVNRIVSRLSPWCARVHYYLGNALLGGLGDVEAAREAFVAAWERNPYDDAYRDFALALLTAPPAAAAPLERAVGLLRRDAERFRPESPHPLVRLAYSLARQGQAARAWRALDAADERLRANGGRIRGYRSALARAALVRVASDAERGPLRALETWRGEGAAEIERRYYAPSNRVRVVDAIEAARLYLERGHAARALGILEGVRDLPLRRGLGRIADVLAGERTALAARALAALGRSDEASAALRSACARRNRPPSAAPSLLARFPELVPLRSRPELRALFAPPDGALRARERSETR